MKTPIVDFVKNYIKSDMSRLHMPGHKGKNFIGIEKYDITEIFGADVLSDASGIIGESENNASFLFESAHTFYTAGGSTTAIYAMLSLVKKAKAKQTVLALRNVHKSFVNACALLDYDVDWVFDEHTESIIDCKISYETIENKIINSNKKYTCVYITSPDYLGNMQNILKISKVCKKYGIPLIVDNAHGAYLKFSDKKMHPIDLGADMCCDSAHKTLPVLTGGAYLHVSKDAPNCFLENAREKISLFSSTSPSYLVLESLDMCNKYLNDGYREKLKKCIKKIDKTKEFIVQKGFAVCNSEPLKIVIDTKKSGYLGVEIANTLRKHKIEPEFYDDDFVVLMMTCENKNKDFKRIKNAFSSLEVRKEIKKEEIKLSCPIKKMSIRDAVFSDSEIIDAQKSVGRICASLTVSCPPAVPIAICGEEITEETVKLFKHYRVKKIKVVKNNLL